MAAEAVSDPEAGSATAEAAAAEAASMPLPYAIGADGRKQPLPGAYALFLRSGTIAAMGLEPPAAADADGGGDAEAAAAEPPQPQARAPTVSLPREKILADIQLAGAISDFHPIRDAVKAADYEPLVARRVEDDAYGDGSNWEIACTRAAADAWLEADTAAAQAAAAAAAAAAAESAAAAAAPRAKRRRPPRPWVDQGSEAELAAAAAPPPGPPARLLLERPLRDFRARAAAPPPQLDEPPAADLWGSVGGSGGDGDGCGGDEGAAEPAPAPAPAAAPAGAAGPAPLRRARREAAAQAVPELSHRAVQASAGARAVPASTQCAPRDLGPAEKQAALAAPALESCLDALRNRCEEALLQNAVAGPPGDDLAALRDDDAAGGADGAPAAAGAAAQGGGGGGGPAGGLVELQSATDLEYSRNKVVSWLQWLPNRRGVVAAAVTDPASFEERLGGAGRLRDAHVLIWNFRDPIRPEAVLECPHEVTCFQPNPLAPNIVIWDLSDEAERIAARSRPAPRSGAGDGGGEDGGGSGGGGGGAGGGTGGGGGEPPVVRLMSSLEASHSAAVSDIHWLPGVELDRAGRAFPARAGSAGGGGGGAAALSTARSGALGTAAAAAAAALQASAVPRECAFLATLAPDGGLLFWDARADRLRGRGARRGDDADAPWRPVHAVHLLNAQGVDFAGTRLCLDYSDLLAGSFLAGAADGQLLGGCFVGTPGSENPEYTRFCHAPHAGAVVALARSPLVPGLVVSVADWRFLLWRDGGGGGGSSGGGGGGGGGGTPLPTRPALLFLGDASGCLHVWDLLDRTHEPALRLGACGAAITSLAAGGAPPPSAPALAALAGAGQAGGGGGGAAAAAAAGAVAAAAAAAHHQLLAVGDATGTVRLLALPRTLRRPMHGEARLMGEFLRREEARVAEVAARQPSRAAAVKALEAAAKEREDAAAAVAAAAAAAAQQQLQPQHPGPPAGEGAPAAARRRSSFGGAAGDARGRGGPGAAGGGGGGSGPGGAALPPAVARAEGEYKRLEAEFLAGLAAAG
ncbi:hypothetical protein Rsub_09360 [Raphidocelis subcapitata]|uniref:Uncharacterized protein n=1 Tax=Raphidocelis subcapitata TaxID=307507 RepID=A0A2V0P9U1_9CHLO|nr:hypothetical protein Rsub_09360 [Raphidocelis subcapitata]|eukprot:GBF96614.1 hypothetical protein Rsub_09360 [Raphidocelis subcapitata]